MKAAMHGHQCQVRAANVVQGLTFDPDKGKLLAYPVALVFKAAFTDVVDFQVMRQHGSIVPDLPNIRGPGAPPSVNRDFYRIVLTDRSSNPRYTMNNRFML